MAFLQGSNLDQDLVQLAPSRVPQRPPMHDARNFNVGVLL